MKRGWKGGVYYQNARQGSERNAAVQIIFSPCSRQYSCSLDWEGERYTVFERAFASVKKDKLWARFLTLGVSGRIVRMDCGCPLRRDIEPAAFHSLFGWYRGFLFSGCKTLYSVSSRLFKKVFRFVFLYQNNHYLSVWANNGSRICVIRFIHIIIIAVLDKDIDRWRSKTLNTILER